MKNFTFAFIVILVIANRITFAAGHPAVDASVTVLAKSHHIFYFKVCKNMIGGRVEVYAHDGSLIRTQKLNRSKFIVDFIDLEPGDYTVKVTKDCFEEIFDYHRNPHASDTSNDDDTDSLVKEEKKPAIN